MAKKTFNPGALLAPTPVVMVSCGNGEEKNIITIAWTGIMNSDPPIMYISVRKSRHSHGLISKTGEFVVNMVDEDMARACDFCGVKSGRDADKWKEMHLTPEESEVVSCPMIGESPLSLECKVIETLEYGSHDVFIAEIVSAHAREDIVDAKGKICLEKAKLIAYCHGAYTPLDTKAIGTFGFSVMKPKTAKRKAGERRQAQRNHKK